MKYVRTLGLTVMMVSALVAFHGIGGASATVICENNFSTEICPAPYAIGTEGTASLASSSSAKLKEVGPEGETLNTCKESTVTGVLKSQGSGKPALSELTTLTFSSCNFPTKTLKPGSGELTWIKGTDSGTLKTSGTEVTMNTIFFGSCIYGTGESLDMGTTMGGNPGSLAATTIVRKLSGSNFACPAELEFSATYIATSPTNAWVSNG